MPTTQIKICGISTPDTLDAAIGAGATHVGFVHFAKSPRHLPFDQMFELRQRVPDHVDAVLLMVDPDPALLREALRVVSPDVIQLHGKEEPSDFAAIRAFSHVALWKALPIRTTSDVDKAARFGGAADLVLFDAPAPYGADLPGGNGVRIDWTILSGYRGPIPWGLAGGLTPENVAEAIQLTGAPLVDVSSGVERAPGIKDVDKIVRFCKAVTAL